MIYLNGHRYYSIEDAMKVMQLKKSGVTYNIYAHNFKDVVIVRGRTYILATEVHALVKKRRNGMIEKINKNPKGNTSLTAWVPKSLYKKVLMVANSKTRGNVSKLILPLIERTYGGKK